MAAAIDLKWIDLALQHAAGVVVAQVRAVLIGLPEGAVGEHHQAFAVHALDGRGQGRPGGVLGGLAGGVKAGADGISPGVGQTVAAAAVAHLVGHRGAQGHRAGDGIYRRANHARGEGWDHEDLLGGGAIHIRTAIGHQPEVPRPAPGGRDGRTQAGIVHHRQGAAGRQQRGRHGDRIGDPGAIANGVRKGVGRARRRRGRRGIDDLAVDEGHRRPRQGGGADAGDEQTVAIGVGVVRRQHAAVEDHLGPAYRHAHGIVDCDRRGVRRQGRRRYVQRIELAALDQVAGAGGCGGAVGLVHAQVPAVAENLADIDNARVLLVFIERGNGRGGDPSGAVAEAHRIGLGHLGEGAAGKVIHPDA